MDTDITTVEVNNIKIEVNASKAKRTTTYKVGDNVKVLIKGYNDYKVYPGVIIGFHLFDLLPTIVICYLETGYTPAVRFVYINKETKDIEICAALPGEVLLERNSVEQILDKEIEKAELAVQELKAKRNYFLAEYDLHFNVNKS